MIGKLLIGGAAAFALSGAALAQSAGSSAGSAAGTTSPAPGTTAGSTDSSVGNGINMTLKAGQIRGSDQATVGGAGAGSTIRSPYGTTGTMGTSPYGTTTTGTLAPPTRRPMPGTGVAPATGTTTGTTTGTGAAP
jgi:hypothetical protein